LSQSNNMESTSHDLKGNNTQAEREKAVRERALQLKTLQQALTGLPPLQLYIFLDIRSDPLITNNFH
jgi:hypothetical protein